MSLNLEDNANVCPICLGAYVNPGCGECGHLLCIECFTKLNIPKCPTCNMKIDCFKRVYGIRFVDSDDY